MVKMHNKVALSLFIKIPTTYFPVLLIEGLIPLGEWSMFYPLVVELESRCLINYSVIHFNKAAICDRWSLIFWCSAKFIETNQSSWYFTRTNLNDTTKWKFHVPQEKKRQAQDH